MTSVLDSMIASLHFDERRSKENGQDVRVRRSLYKYIYLVCGALVLGGLYRWNATLPLFRSVFSKGRAVKFGPGETFDTLRSFTKFCHCRLLEIIDTSVILGNYGEKTFLQFTIYTEFFMWNLYTE